MWRPWWLKKPEEQRAISYQDFWGAGGNIEEINGNSISNALTLVPVFAATRLISDAVASLPLGAYRRQGEKQTSIKTPQLLADPTMFGGPYEWVQRCLLSLLLRGNAYGLITGVDQQGFPRQVEWLHPDEVSLEDDTATARPRWLWNGRRVDPWLGRDSAGELVHIPWYVLPGRIQGLSPIAQFRATIEGGIYAQRFGRDFFKNGAVPSAVLETDQPVDEDQAKLIKQRLKAAAQGRDTVVLGAGAKYKPITVPPEESQFLETIGANATMIASIYGIYPAELIGGDTKDSMTYANVEQQSLNLATFTLRPSLVRLEQHFSTLLPRPQFAQFDVDGVLRADRKTRYETHAIALEKGFKTVDEVREEEHLDGPMPKQEPPAALPAGNDGEGGTVVQLPRAANE